MCVFDTPKAPAVAEVQKPQEVKQVEQGAFGATSTARKKAAEGGGMAASTLLTGPTGIENNQLMLGKTTLLGQ
jgi:hypothetical protein